MTEEIDLYYQITREALETKIKHAIDMYYDGIISVDELMVLFINAANSMR